MENASKALLISGATLLMILMLSFAIYMAKQMGENVNEMYEMMEETEINEFNQGLLNFDGKNNLTIQDVVSILNFAKDNNDRKSIPVTVEIYIDGVDIKDKIQLSGDSYSDYVSNLLKDNIGKTYSCVVSYATNSKLVGIVRIITN